MAYKRINKMDLKEIIRRWQNKQSISEISRSMSLDRKTVRKYILQIKLRGITQEGIIEDKASIDDLCERVKIERVQNKGKREILGPYMDEIKRLIVEEGLKVNTAYDIINMREEIKGKVSASTFRRFVNENGILRKTKQITCRIEVEPGKQIQIDYAKVGTIYDPIRKKKRTVYAFIGTLSHSRHKYVEFVYSQDQVSFVSSHVRMFNYFSGIPEHILIDNLKSGVINPDLYDPRLNRSYQEMAEYYGCFIDPCRVRHPQDKGKVERDVQTIREQFKKYIVINPNIDIQHANKLIQTYLIDEYGQKLHGTTRQRPHQVFTEVEQPVLKKLQEEDFVIAQWKEASVHPDCYIQFNKKAYSVPFTYVGKKVWVRGTEKLIQVYYNEQLIKQHTFSNNFRQTDFSDFPENVNAVLNTGLHKFLIDKAEKTGENFHKLILKTLNPQIFINLRKAQGLVNLSEKFDSNIIERASQIVLFQNCCVNFKSFKLIVEKLNEQKESNDESKQFSNESLSFIRDGNYFIHNN